MNFLDKAKEILVKHTLMGNHSFCVGLGEFIKEYDSEWTVARHLEIQGRNVIKEMKFNYAERASQNERNENNI